MNTRKDAPRGPDGLTPLERWQKSKPALVQRPMKKGMESLKIAAFGAEMSAQAARMLRISMEIKHDADRGRGGHVRRFSRDADALLEKVVNATHQPETKGAT